jgi:hypothetical protein
MELTLSNSHIADVIGGTLYAQIKGKFPDIRFFVKNMNNAIFVLVPKENKQEWRFKKQISLADIPTDPSDARKKTITLVRNTIDEMNEVLTNANG